MLKQIGIIERCAIMYRNQAFKEIGLNGCSHSYILHVCRNPGITQDALAKLIHVNKSNVCRNLAMLEELGYIYRKESETDKRSTLVYPTDKAIETLPKIREILHKFDTMVTSVFTEEEKDLINEKLCLAAKNAMKMVGDSDA